jgi:hypothetical protein
MKARTLPTPPILGLQDSCPILAILCVTISARAPTRAAAAAASQPAWPPPTTMTSHRLSDATRGDITFKRGVVALKLAVVVVLELAVLVCVARDDSAWFNRCAGRDAEGSNSKRRHINMGLGIIACDVGDGEVFRGGKESKRGLSRRGVATAAAAAAAAAC